MKEMKLILFFAVVIITTPFCTTVAIEETTNDISKHNIAITDDSSQDYTIKIQDVENLEILKGRAGQDGLPGPQGEKGEQGPQGIQGPPGPSCGGALYTRWGRTVCPNTTGTELVYEGLAAGSFFTNAGGGTNYLCITEDPEYLSTKTPTSYALLYGSEYEQLVHTPSVNNHNVPCAVCHTSQRSSKLMIPGKISCPQSWTEEYTGYLMTEYRDHKHSSTFECVDKDPETVPGEAHDTNGALFYHVGAVCNVGLPCPSFVANRPITCVVCTK